MTVKNNDRLDESLSFALTLTRAIAIILVTGFHTYRRIGYPTAKIGSFNLYGIFEYGDFGVGLFFLLAGFLAYYSMSKQDYKQFNELAISFYTNRFLRLAPAYYISLFIWYILIENGIAIKSYGLKDIITHIFFIHNLWEDTIYSTSGVFWYLAPLMQMYLITPIIFFVDSKINRVKSYNLVIGIIYVISFLPGYICKDYSNTLLVTLKDK